MSLPPRSVWLCAVLSAACLAPAVARADSRLANISVRSSAGAGADTLIVGFAITGTGSKQMLVRGVGPTLAQYGVTGYVADPRIALYDDQDAPLATNDDWGGTATLASAFGAVGAFPLPNGSHDAALSRALSAGSYTLHLTSSGNPGIALVEAYDGDGPASTARIANVSARSLAGTGENTLTVGFAIAGDTPKTVLIRAVGPSLAEFGVTGLLTDPQLTLFSSSGNVLGRNDNWLGRAGWASAFSAVGAFALPANSTDSALLVTLAPGTYTAQATGAGGGTGVALVEVYEVPNPPADALVLQPVENTRPTSYGDHPVSPTTGPGAGTVPTIISQIAPAYPAELAHAGVTGEAVIQFVVGPDGTVVDGMILRATDVRFGIASLAAVLKWTFQPATANGTAVYAVLEVPVEFSFE